MKMTKTNKKVSIVQVILTVVFVSTFLISNITSTKQMSLPFGITMPSAMLIFPITYILSDVFSEVYGYKWSRMTCYLAFAMNLFMVSVFSIAIAMPHPEFWTNQEAFATVLGNTPRMLVASLAAYVVGDLVNDRVFRKMKVKNDGTIKGFGWRALVSSFCGEVVDSAIFYPVAFLGQMPVKTLVTMGICQVLIKISYEIVILPVTTHIVKKLNKYEAEV